MIGRGITPTL